VDFVDVSIVNIALPSMQKALHLSVLGLQWVPGGYLLTDGGFMLLGGRAADLLGRRRVLLAGLIVIGCSSCVGGLAGNSGVLIGARLVQGLGAALTLPAALSLLTTSFGDGPDRHRALGVWGAMAGIGSIAGVLFGGLLTEGPGWRWVLFVNPIIVLLLLVPVIRLLPDEPGKGERRNFDALGALLATGGMMLLVYALVQAPSQGWGAATTIGELAGSAGLLALFVVNELRHSNPLAPLSIFKINGLGFADLTQLTVFIGFFSLFFFLTLYMQEVLHYSAIKTGLACLPLCLAVGVSSGIASQLLVKVGTRTVMVSGALIAAGGLFWLSHLSVHGTFLSNILPGTLLASLGIGAVFVGVATAANSGVPADKAGLAAALLNASQQLGGALGLAILTAAATSRTRHLLQAHANTAHALASGFHLALLVGSAFIAASAIVALKATNTKGELPRQDNGGFDVQMPA
jgi:EmrB/QacA subfamily drug resistance transporter